MKYGNTLIILSIFNILVAYSGLPTGWKKLLIIIVSLVIIAIGWLLRRVAQKRAKRTHEMVSRIETSAQPDINDVADEVAFDVANQVEQEIDEIMSSTEHGHHYE